jgi:hypothetical protein
VRAVCANLNLFAYCAPDGAIEAGLHSALSLRMFAINDSLMLGRAGCLGHVGQLVVKTAKKSSQEG